MFLTVEEQDNLQKAREATAAAAKANAKKRKAPMCKTCGKPKKGHPRSSCATDN
jgi:hypothetical protein